MGLFKKKLSEKQKTVKDIDLIKSNTQAIDVLIVYVQEEVNIVTKLKEIQEKMKYLNPSDEEKVLHMDKKIADKLGDIKIAFSKSSQKGCFDGWKLLIKDLEVLLAERNAKL